MELWFLKKISPIRKPNKISTTFYWENSSPKQSTLSFACYFQLTQSLLLFSGTYNRWNSEELYWWLFSI